MTDTFRGDDAALVDSINAMIGLNAADALTPRVPAMAIGLLESAAERLSRPSRMAASSEGEAVAWRVDWLIDGITATHFFDDEAAARTYATHIDLSDAAHPLPVDHQGKVTPFYASTPQVAVPVSEERSVLQRIHDGYRVNHTSKWVHRVVSEALAVPDKGVQGDQGDSRDPGQPGSGSQHEADVGATAALAGRRMRCKACNSPRAASPCQKCGGLLSEAHPDWDETSLPDIDRIRALAREVGYAVGVHGSLERDLDLIAIPWSAGAVSPPELAAHIASGLPGRVLDDQTQDKPNGRWACNISPEGWFKMVDLSVMPPAPRATASTTSYITDSKGGA